jgi:hypothetical protein
MDFLMHFQLQSKLTVLHQLVGEKVISNSTMTRSLQATLDQVETVSSYVVFTIKFNTPACSLTPSLLHSLTPWLCRPLKNLGLLYGRLLFFQLASIISFS